MKKLALLQSVKLVLVVATVSFVLTGCSLDDILGNAGSNMNTDLGTLDTQIVCSKNNGVDVTAAKSPEGTFKWALMGPEDDSQWLSVYFKTDRTGGKNDPAKTTFNYYPLIREFPVPASALDQSIDIFLDETFRDWGYDTGGQPDRPENKVWGTLLTPMVTQGSQRIPWTQLTPFKSSSSTLLDRYPRKADSEVYFLNNSFYCQEDSGAFKQIGRFNPYQKVSASNFPALIFVLYKPEQYALLPNAAARKSVMATKDLGYQNNAVGMLFDVYYSVYHYNRFYTDGKTANQTCQVQDFSIDGFKLTPPWDFGVCKCRAVPGSGTSQI